MKTLHKTIEYSRLPKDYAGLCRILTPRRIHDQAEFQNVAEITDALAGYRLTPDQADYFDILCRLIEDYEKEQIRVETTKVTGLEALRHLLEAHHMNTVDFARLLNVHRTLGAMILRGERRLTLAHVKTLARHFGISSDVFLG